MSCFVEDIDLLGGSWVDPGNVEEFLKIIRFPFKHNLRLPSELPRVTRRPPTITNKCQTNTKNMLNIWQNLVSTGE